MSDRPPLHPIQWEQTELAAKQVDATYWKELKTLQVHYDGPATISPSKSPLLLLNRLEMYAGALFRLEAAQYPKDDPHYRAWLEALAVRIVSRVLRAVEEVDAVSPDAKLTWHSLGIDKMRDGLETFLQVVITEYAGRAIRASLQDAIEPRPQPAHPFPTPPTSNPLPTQPNSSPPAEKPRNVRREFVDPLLQERGWSLLDWATEANVAYHTVADYLTGKTKPYRDTRLKMAKSLGVSVQQLPK